MNSDIVEFGQLNVFIGETHLLTNMLEEIAKNNGRQVLNGYEDIDILIKCLNLVIINHYGCLMHPWILKHTLSNTCKSIINGNDEKQYFISIHNPMGIDGLHLYDDRIRLFAITKKDNNQIDIQRLQFDRDAIKELEMADMPLSYLYMTGRFGGTPGIEIDNFKGII